MTAVAELDRHSDSHPDSRTAGDYEQRAGSGVSSASNPSDAPVAGGSSSTTSDRAPSEEQLLDVLYEVLAQGVPARSSLKREEIERFLHQHARQRKPIEEMVKFFELHNLPVDAGEYGSDRELRELASGLQKERSSLVPGFGPSELVPPVAPLPPQVVAPVAALAQPAAPQPLGHAAELAAIDGEPTGRRAFPKPPAPTPLRWIGLFAAVIAAGLLAAFFVSQQRANQLEQRLDQARMQQRSTDLALTKLEQRAQTLQGEIEQSEQARREQTERLESTLAAEKQQRSTEELAVERVLGPRYLKLRAKLTNEAASAQPGSPTTSAVAPALRARTDETHATTPLSPKKPSP